MTLRISVALATYNGENYIEQQMDSILNQTRSVHEIIVYDDASSDQTLAKVKQYQFQDDVVVHIFSQDHNVGYIENFGKALKMTNGDVIFLCDQDDIWETDKVEKMMNIFEKNPNIQCVASAFNYIDQAGEPIGEEDTGNNHNLCWNRIDFHDAQLISFDEILYHNISMGCTMAFRSCIKDIYLASSNKIAAHDWEINLIAALNNGLIFYNEPLLRYRIHEQNTTGNDKMKDIDPLTSTQREKNAKALIEFTKCLPNYYTYMSEEQIEAAKNVTRFHEKRFLLLQKGKLRVWLSLIMQKEIYRKVVSGKGILTDLLYVINKK